ncbi:unnamed protein product [Caenorhabditis sp. 36 PRJEB53466]|nr:unnamed protein product [Caenorhabditis sp. 36 PRJEB53466]
MLYPSVYALLLIIIVLKVFDRKTKRTVTPAHRIPPGYPPKGGIRYQIEEVMPRVTRKTKQNRTKHIEKIINEMANSGQQLYELSEQKGVAQLEIVRDKNRFGNCRRSLLREMKILLILPILCTIVRARESGAEAAAGTILSTWDQALISHNFEPFLALHADDFTFHVCDSSGTTREQFKSYLVNDLQLWQVWKSKHTQIGSPLGHHNISSVAYQKNLLLSSYKLLQTQGTILFEVTSSAIRIISSYEPCPVVVF